MWIEQRLQYLRIRCFSPITSNLKKMSIVNSLEFSKYPNSLVALDHFYIEFENIE